MDVTSRTAEVSPRLAARIAGYGYLVIFVLAIFANFFVRSRLIEPGDATATAGNILGSETTFRFGLVAFMVVFLVDVAIAWALYIFFRPAGRDLSLLSAWFRLVYTVLLGVAVLGFFLVLRLLSGSDALAAFDVAQRDAHVALFLDGFNYVWLVGLASFGIHLLLIGYLILRSGWAPRALAIVLALAGAAYVGDTLANALLANYDEYETTFLAIVAVPSVVGELWLALWLLMRGGRGEAALEQVPQERDR